MGNEQNEPSYPISAPGDLPRREVFYRTVENIAQLSNIRKSVPRKCVFLAITPGISVIAMPQVSSGHAFSV